MKQMKQVFGGAILVAMLSAGCSLDTGVDGPEEIADEENLGSISEALTTGFWNEFFLDPLAPMLLPNSDRWVCRNT